MDFNHKKYIRPLGLLLSLTISSNGFSKVPFTELTTANNATDTTSEATISNQIPSDLNVHSLGLGLGQTVLAGEFRERAEDGISADLLYNYSASYSFDLYANAHYSEHKFKQEVVKLPGINAGIKAKFYQYDSFSPFIIGGLGFYRPFVKRYVEDQLLSSEEKITFGLNFGAGIELILNRHYAFGILAHYHNPFDIKQENGPEVEGSYFKTLLTGLYRF